MELSLIINISIAFFVSFFTWLFKAVYNKSALFTYKTKTQGIGIAIPPKLIISSGKEEIWNI